MEIIRATQILKAAEPVESSADYDIYLVPSYARVYNPYSGQFINFVLVYREYQTIEFSHDSLSYIKQVLKHFQKARDNEHANKGDDTPPSMTGNIIPIGPTDGSSKH